MRVNIHTGQAHQMGLFNYKRVNNMKKSDLHRRYADVVDLCEGTSIDPSIDGVKYDGEPAIHSNFTGRPELYEFMLAIVDDKPVFYGDVLYHKDKGVYTVQQIEKFNNGRLAFKTTKHPLAYVAWVDGDWVENYSWNPHKKDEYSELKQAQNEGNKIAWLSDNGNWYEQRIRTDDHFKQYPVNRWKVVEDDLIIEFPLEIFNKTVRVSGVKSGLYGNITLKVIE
jgi:hypothetical protein